MSVELVSVSALVHMSVSHCDFHCECSCEGLYECEYKCVSVSVMKQHLVVLPREAHPKVLCKLLYSATQGSFSRVLRDFFCV